MFYALKKSTSELQPPSGSPVPLQGGHWEVHTPPGWAVLFQSPKEQRHRREQQT